MANQKIPQQYSKPSFGRMPNEVISYNPPQGGACTGLKVETLIGWLGPWSEHVNNAKITTIWEDWGQAKWLRLVLTRLMIR